MASDKLYNLKINPGAKSSRFVVELKADSAENKTAEPMEKQAKPNVETRLEMKLDKLAEVDYGKIISKGKTKFAGIFKYAGFKKSLSDLKSQLAVAAPAAKTTAARQVKRKKVKLEPGRWEIWATLDQLAFVGLAKFVYAIFKNIFIGLYKICYWIGWLIMFVLRLVYFFFISFGLPLEKMASVLLFTYKAVMDFAFTLFKRFLPLGKLGVEMTKIKTKADKIPLTPFVKGGINQERIIGYLKTALAFAVVLLVIVLPLKAYTYYKSLDNIKGRVLGESASAVNDMISGGRAAADLNFGQADKNFAAAGNNFLSAQESLNEINGLIFALASIIPDKNIKLAASGKNILRAGELSAEAGKNLSLAMAGLFNYQPDGNANLFSDLSFYGHNTIVNLTALNEVLGQIDSGLIPELYQKQFILLKQKSLELSRGLGEFIALADSLDNFLGTSVDKRYLLVFQNNSELRASGGFIGSFAIIDFSKGEIKNITVPGGGSYDTEAGLLKKIKAPEPLSLVRADWHFWDANWWPDWPTSARKLAWFYENSDGSTVDGVVSFTPTVMEKLLKIIGPIDLKEKYGSTTLTTGGLVIDADNFWLETQKLAEQKLDVTNQPKKIIGDLMNKIVEELPKRLNKSNLVPLLKVMEESLADKNILFYFTDKALEDKAKEMGWGGEIKATSGDYLSVINTNIAGGKSDRKIKQEIFHSAEIQADGSIIDTLTVRRTHQGIKREIFSGVRNVNWLRIYVPLGSELIAAEGFKPVDKIFFKTVDPAWQNDQEVLAAESLARTFEPGGTKIYDELGKTVFANWSQLDPGETVEIKIKYRLPFKLTDKKEPAREALADQLIYKAAAVLNPEQKNLYSYSLLTQKQPGMNSSLISSELKLSDNFKSIWQYPSALSVSQAGWQATGIFDRDKITAVMIEN